MRRVHATAVAMVIGAFGEATGAGVMEFTDKEDWIAAVGQFTTIGFTEFPNNTFITDQYAEQGVFFLDGDDNIVCCSFITFPEDGAGLDGNAAIHLSFSEPQRWIAADYPGAVHYDLFFLGKLVYTSSNFPGSGIGFFAGLL